MSVRACDLNPDLGKKTLLYLNKKTKSHIFQPFLTRAVKVILWYKTREI